MEDFGGENEEISFKQELNDSWQLQKAFTAKQGTSPFWERWKKSLTLHLLQLMSCSTCLTLWPRVLRFFAFDYIIIFFVSIDSDGWCYKACDTPHTNSSRYLLGLIIGSLTDAIELFSAALLTTFTLHTDVVVHLLCLLFCDADTLSVIPVGTQVTANVEPSEK